uniref:Phospholipase-like, aminotransferase-like mobile domain protein n=1 Tax=Tanacetum cinerariifolium TaxID=118510 RepID=A0A6L2MV95_TANCI|nr:phospholipase-like, aminotransferase-like mobile domain protein [Tanacetum cinerariifolium]
MTSYDSIGTPIATKHLDADLSGTPVDQTKYRNSDHAGCLDSRKSTSSGIQFLGGDKLVSWSSKKQDCTSMSSAEAEYVSLSACYAQVLWMRTQLTYYGFHFDKIPMYCDSKAAIAISCNHVQHSRTKHIDVRYHFIKEKVEKGIVELFFVETEYQLVGLFTKAFPVERFKYLVRRLEHPSDTKVFAVKMEILLEPTSNKLLEYPVKIDVRSKLHYFSLIKDRLNESRRLLFRTTCFGPWLDISYVENDGGMIHYVLQKQSFIDDESFDLPLIYHFNGHSLHFGCRQFCLVTGFKFGLISLREHRNGDIPFRNRLFSKKIGYDVKIIDVLAFIEDEEKFSKVSDEDTIRLCLLLSLEVIYMGRELVSIVDDAFLRMVNDLDA